MGIRVRAVRKVGYRKYVGFYEKLMTNGEVFEIAKPEHFSTNWMEPADDEAKKVIDRYLAAKRGVKLTEPPAPAQTEKAAVEEKKR